MLNSLLGETSTGTVRFCDLLSLESGFSVSPVEGLLCCPTCPRPLIVSAVPLLCYRKCPRSGLDFPPFDYTDGLDASGNFISAAGTLFPIALCGLSSL